MVNRQRLPHHRLQPCALRALMVNRLHNRLQPCAHRALVVNRPRNRLQPCALRALVLNRLQDPRLRRRELPFRQVLKGPHINDIIAYVHNLSPLKRKQTEHNRFHNFNPANGCHYNSTSSLLLEDKTKAPSRARDKKSTHKDITLHEIRRQD